MDGQEMKATTPATYADIEALPEHVVGELIDGELIVSPRPASPHAFTASNLGGELHNPFYRGRGGPGGWIILGEPELHIGNDVLVPDLAGWRVARYPVNQAQLYFTVMPDWICEVLSPSTERIDRARKMTIYANAQVKYVWLVNPILQILEVYVLVINTWRLLDIYAGTDVVRAEPFTEFELELNVLWEPTAP